jgi:hypothetical protein
VGVRRIHTLTHPGLSFLLAVDGSPESSAAARIGILVARAADARLTLLAAAATDPQDEIRRFTEAAGDGWTSLDSIVSASPAPEALASDRGARSSDLVIAVLPAGDPADYSRRLLQATDAHLFLVRAAPRRDGLPRSALICAAAGEPGKETISFAARFLRHLGSEAIILTVLPPDHDQPAADLAERFLSAGVRTMAGLGVTARGRQRSGPLLDVLAAEIDATVPDLIVIGAPAADPRSRTHRARVATALVERDGGAALLIVRSGQAALSR